MRYLLALLISCVCASGFAAVVDTPINLKSGGAAVVNIPLSATINSTENTLTVSITAGVPRTVLFVSDVGWYYRAVTSGTSVTVAAAQSLILLIPANCVIYFQRQSADGTLTILPLK